MVSLSIGDFSSKITSAAKGLPDDTVKLAVNGKLYEGWQNLTLKRSLKAISGHFQLAVIDRWEQGAEPWQISPGDECRLMIGDESLITGYVDEAEPSYDEGSHSIAISGRDKSGDLVDCSIEQKPFSWQSISLLTLAKRVALPFGVGVTVDLSAAGAAVTGFAWKINPGESAFETLDRAARLRGVILTNDGAGNIVITRAGTTHGSSELVEGQNILKASATFSMKDRFSKYIVKSQDEGLEGSDPSVDFAAHGTATDPTVKRYRPIMIRAEGAATSKVCRIRAEWEASVRVGKSSKISISVVGWRQADGSLWKPNQIVRVTSPKLGINIELLVTDVTFRKTIESAITDLVFEPASAYTPDPTLITRKEPWRQLVLENSKRK